jgi:hypothetical protein
MDREEPTVTVVWEDPPARSQGKQVEFFNLVRTRPGEWARYPKVLGSRAGASQMRKKYPDFEIEARAVDGGFAVWVRCPA